MANSNWADDNLPKPPIPSAVPRPVERKRTEPDSGWDALRELFESKHGAGYNAAVLPNGDTVTFDPAAELVAEGLVDIFVHELDILDCPQCFASHFQRGETCRKHDV